MRLDTPQLELSLACGAGALDIAVLRLRHPPTGLQPLELSTAPLLPGAPAFAWGYALFNPVSGQPPLLTCGAVSRVLTLPDATGRQLPAMLLTTAAVHAGASGGAMLDGAGRMLGLITSNTRHASGRTIPHLNFSIPAAWLQRLWAYLQQSQVTSHYFVQTGAKCATTTVAEVCMRDVLQMASSIRVFDDTGPQLKRLWSLQPFVEDMHEGQPLLRSKI